MKALLQHSLTPHGAVLPKGMDQVIALRSNYGGGKPPGASEHIYGPTNIPANNEKPDQTVVPGMPFISDIEAVPTKAFDYIIVGGGGARSCRAPDRKYCLLSVIDCAGAPHTRDRVPVRCWYVWKSGCSLASIATRRLA